MHMVVRIYEYIVGCLSALSKRIQALSQGSSRPLLGIFFLLSALGLGRYAYFETGNDILSEWKQNHGPSGPLLIQTLRYYGFEKEEMSKGYNKMYRSLPLTTDSKGSFWITEDTTAIAKFNNEDLNESIPSLFMKKGAQVQTSQYVEVQTSQYKDKPSLKWESLGAGWEAFEVLLKKLDEKSRHAISKKSPPQFLDPRAIHY